MSLEPNNLDGVPAIYGRLEFAAAGGLMSYRFNVANDYRLIGDYASRILYNHRWHAVGCGGCRILQRSIVMKTLITVLAVAAVFATSAVAKTQRPKEVRVQPNNSVSHNAVRRSPTQINSYCRFDRGETDPDRRIVLQLHRDCRDWELDEAE
jgi:hypothetical protein